ncbi:uroporphyrinogen decarboxylase family protein [Ruminococcus gauvreauii]|uniref:Uroporphyrinogen decarboxylase family protein n=1 Tax=Ruminococcus gauvreauii TaxID=438033 RepID=A0ABY5VFK7_9FIRM|nr:uroporphyrinogen decarboxylase family protein [Ruminococcus gauvreauii]UWP59295.1 uroporphyrinogen decarboxylase family protein [Ruminococcus gauvreauii]
METTRMSFLAKRMGNFANLANWPNANVLNTALVTEYIPEMCKVPYDLLFRDDPRAMAECTLLIWEYLRLDLLTANMDVYNFEAEAMGAKINFYKNHCPDFDRDTYFIQGNEDLDKIKYTGLKSGRFPYLIEYSRIFKQYTGVDTFPIFSAPWTLAGNLYGLDNLIVDTVTNPDFVHELLRRIVDDFHVPMYKELSSVIPGMTEVALVDAFATIPMVTVSIVDTFIRPYLERLMEKLDMPGMPLLDTAFFGSSLLSEDDRRKFEEFVIFANGRFFCSDPDAAVLTPEYARARATECLLPLQTGVDAKVLQFGTVDEVIDRVRHYVLAGKNGPTPCVFFFNNIAPNVPLENVQAAINTVEIYGAPGADENTPYTEPEFLTFEDFLRRKIADNNEGYTYDWLKQSGYAYLA